MCVGKCSLLSDNIYFSLNTPSNEQMTYYDFRFHYLLRKSYLMNMPIINVCVYLKWKIVLIIITRNEYYNEIVTHKIYHTTQKSTSNTFNYTAFCLNTYGECNVVLVTFSNSIQECKTYITCQRQRYPVGNLKC